MDPEVGNLAEQGLPFVGHKTAVQEVFDDIVSKILEKLLLPQKLPEN
jgi:hypothetical protein